MLLPGSKHKLLGEEVGAVVVSQFVVQTLHTTIGVLAIEGRALKVRRCQRIGLVPG